MILLPFCLIVCSMIIYIPAIAQEQPPKPIEVAFTGASVITAQNLCFGTFILAGSSGTVTVKADGSREAFPPSFLPAALLSSSVSPSPAIFIVTALPGTLITIQGSASTLTNMSAGSVTLTMSDSDPISPFVVPKVFGQKYTEVVVKIGGTLTISSSTTTGVYGGPFIVTFIQQ